MNNQPMTDQQDDDEASLLPLAGRELGRPVKAPTDGKALDGQIDFRTFKMVSSPKLDGNRCLILAGQAYTAQMRVARNAGLSSFLAPLLERSRAFDLMFDMELYDSAASHHAVTSGVLNAYDAPISDTTKAYIFDAAPMSAYVDQCIDYPFSSRIAVLSAEVYQLKDPRYVEVQQRMCMHKDMALDWFDRDIENGYEGSILRPLNIVQGTNGPRGGWYKHGRSTVKQHIMFKLKAYQTVDGVITDVLPRRRMVLDVDRVRGPDGRLEPVRQKDAFEDTPSIGAFLVKHRDPNSDTIVESEIGFAKGFSMADREELWSKRSTLIGTWCEFLCLPHGAQHGGSARHGRLTRFRLDKTGDV